MTVNRETAVGSANKAQGLDEPCEFEIAVITKEPRINSGALGWPRECVQTETRIAANSGLAGSATSSWAYSSARRRATN